MQICLRLLKYPTSFLVPLPGNGSYIIYRPSLFLYPFLFFDSTSTPAIMEQPSFQHLSTVKGELLEPPSTQIILTSGCELLPNLITLVWKRSFSGLERKPYFHLRDFEELCSCFAIAGMT
jgi:hypothetical protein